MGEEMKVRDLIKKLQVLNPEAEVFVDNYDGSHHLRNEMIITQVKKGEKPQDSYGNPYYSPEWFDDQGKAKNLIVTIVGE